MDRVYILNRMRGELLDDESHAQLKDIFKELDGKIERLKKNSSALRDTIEKIQAKKKRLKKENKELLLKVSELEAQLASVKPVIKSPALAEVARELMKSCLDSGIQGFCAEDMYASLSYSRLEISAAISDLEQREMIRIGSISADDCQYELTNLGKRQLLQIKNSDYSF